MRIRRPAVCIVRCMSYITATYESMQRMPHTYS
jgi:hypothetical protein